MYKIKISLHKFECIFYQLEAQLDYAFTTLGNSLLSGLDQKDELNKWMHIAAIEDMMNYLRSKKAEPKEKILLKLTPFQSMIFRKMLLALWIDRTNTFAIIARNELLEEIDQFIQVYTSLKMSEYEKI